MIKDDKNYEIAISYASEDRPYVDQVAEFLKRKGVRVFYDVYELVRMWGNNLAEKLKDIYSNQTHFVVMFISKAYAEKMYTNHERRSALDTALKVNYEYILPGRFDDTELPGFYSSTHYLDLRKLSPKQLGNMILEKLNLKGFSFKTDYDGFSEPTLLIWRFTNRKYLDRALTGESASRFPGRWNKLGANMVYGSSSYCSALIEIIAHSASKDFINNMIALPIKVPFDVSIKTVYESVLPVGWKNFPPLESTKDIGENWLKSKETCILSLPSALIKTERTFLINPNHEDFKKLQPLQVEDVDIDERMFE